MESYMGKSQLREALSSNPFVRRNYLKNAAKVGVFGVIRLEKEVV
jgi:hypothetical protein